MTKREIAGEIRKVNKFVRTAEAEINRMGILPRDPRKDPFDIVGLAIMSTGGVSSLFESLDTILEEADEQRFINAIAFRRSEVQTKTSSSDEVSGKANISVALAPNPSASAGAEIASKLVRTSDNDQNFSEVLLRTF